MTIMEKGLYQLVGGDGRELTAEKLANLIRQKDFTTKERKRLLLWLEELKFWEEYSKIYFNLEKARPYSNLSRTISKMIKPNNGERWLDVGCGPLRISELIYQANAEVGSIDAIDIVLSPAKEKIRKLKEKGIYLPVKIKYASITDILPYPNNFFDGLGDFFQYRKNFANNGNLPVSN